LETFWDFFWFMFWAFLWIIWIMLLFRVFADIFRSDSSGWAKAGWIIFVIILPFLGIFIYLIVEGGNMARRDQATAQKVDQAQRDYIRSVAGSGGTADQLEKLASLHNRGVISEDEFQSEKAKLLS
jgi:hypothetical protein